MNLTPDRQIDNHGRDLGGLSLAGGDRWGSHDYRPDDRQASNGRHHLQARRCLTHVSPCITHRGLHCAPVFSIHVARASLSVEPRQRVGAFPPPRTRLAATFKFMHGIMAPCSQFKTSSHKFARQSTESRGLHSSTSFRGLTFQQTERDIRKVVNVQQVVGEIRNV